MLKIWLPLNGNTKNQGILGELTTNSPTYVNGKLGKAMHTGSIKMSAEQTSQVLNNNEVTIAFWVYVNADTGSNNRAMLFGNGDMSANNNRKFALHQYPTCNDFHCSFMNDTANTTFISCVLSGVLPSYKWTHVTMVYKNPIGKIFINGQLKYTTSGISNSSSFAYDTKIVHDSPYHYFNDFRVYDNAISEKEIKILSQGLFVHYPLNQQEKEVNLCPNSYVNETSNAYGFAYRNVLLTAGKTYTLSVNGRVVDGEGGLSTYIYKSDWSQENGHRITDTNDVTFSMSFTPNTTGNYSICSYSFLKQGTAGGNVHVNWYKLIEGTNPSTKWSPAMSDTINWNGIEYDTSGYGNNLSVDGTIINENNSPRYDNCYNFNQTGYLKKEGLNLYADSFTICYWVKIPSSITAQHFIFGTFDSWTNNGVGAWRDSSYELGYDCIMRSTSESTYGVFGGPTVANIAVETWTHIAYVYTGTQIRTYKNGSLVNEKTYGSSGQCYMPNLYLGNSKFGNITTENDESSMSDFRLYTTALSEQDIKELYQSPISITDNGVIITQGEFKEE